MTLSRLFPSLLLYDEIFPKCFANNLDKYCVEFGARDGVRLVVNDQLYVTAESSAVAGSNAINCTVRIKAHVASLTAKDWMAIAIQSTAADN